MPLSDFFEANTDIDYLLPICHGFSCATACLGTQTLEQEQWHDWWQALLENIDTDALDAQLCAVDGPLFALVREEAAQIEAVFNEQERVWLPFNPHPENEALSDWAAAFMIVVMQDAEFWHQKEEIDEALLPIIVFSGLFDDEQIHAIEDDEEILFDMAEEIPELLTDIYLLLNGD